MQIRKNKISQNPQRRSLITKTYRIAVLKEGKIRTVDLDGIAANSEMADAIVAKLKLND
jgi:hypothetical protein